MQMRRGSILSLREIGVCESQGRSAIGVATVLLALVLQHQQHVVEANPLLLEHFATLSPSAASFDLRGFETNAPWPSSINENLSPARKLYFRRRPTGRVSTPFSRNRIVTWLIASISRQAAPFSSTGILPPAGPGGKSLRRSVRNRERSADWSAPQN